MTEAARAILEYGFKELGLKEIVAGVKPDNIASIRVIEKIGLTFQKIITDVSKGCEFYTGMRYYNITEAHI